MKKETESRKGWRALLIVGLSLLLLLEGFAGYKVFTLSDEQERIKADYCTVNSIVFGLLSVSEWRDKITALAENKIRNFNLSPDQQKDLQKEVEEILHGLITKAEGIINKQQASLAGKFKKVAFNALVDVDELHEQVPEFAKEIITRVNAPSSKKRLRRLAESKMNELEKETYDSAQYVKKQVADSLFKKYDVASYEDFQTTTDTSLSAIRKTNYTYAILMLLSILVFPSLWWFLRKKPELYHTLYVFSVLSAFLLLLVGITCTMIEVDARIENFNLVLMGDTITFNNQVLFFQSKSIIDVVHILITTDQYDSILVGVLLLSFSVLFPVFKLLSSCIFLMGKSKWTKGKFISYFTFKSGKWSMADVMVIGILMTYIGFNGIIESQLAHLNIRNESLTSITTNHTALQPGYIIFVGFVLYGLILSQIVHTITTNRKELERNIIPSP